MPSLVRLLTSRRGVTAIGVLGLLGTFGAMLALDASRVGAISLTPWVAAIGVETGVVGGISAGLGALGLFAVASAVEGTEPGFGIILARSGALVVIGLGSALLGSRLRASEERSREQADVLTTLADATIDGFALTDRAGHPVVSNAPLRRVLRELGVPLAPTVPETLLSVADRMVDPGAYNARMRELAADPAARSEDEFELADSGRVFQGFTAPVFDEHGEVAWRVWTLRETTAERELDRLRDTFVAAVSHELRTPLTAIAGFLELLEEEIDGVSAEARHYVRVMQRNTTRLHRLVDDLLLVAQIEAGQLTLAADEVDVDDVVAEAVEAAAPTAEKVGVRLTHEAAGAPPVRGDAQRLGQVVDNLVSNALKFTPAGGSVTVSTSACDGSARIVVADTGVGISPSEQARLFERFFRASGAINAAVPGTGLGLGIARALVEGHDGSIALESREGAGTTVTVELPAYVRGRE